MAGKAPQAGVADKVPQAGVADKVPQAGKAGTVHRAGAAGMVPAAASAAAIAVVHRAVRTPADADRRAVRWVVVGPNSFGRGVGTSR